MKTIGDFITLDMVSSDCFPKEINKAKIKEIFDILQSQDRPDLVKEMKKLVLLKTNGENAEKLPVERKIGHPINKILPSEMLVKILEKLDIKSILLAKQTCMHWRDIINEFELVEKASSKFLNHNYNN